MKLHELLNNLHALVPFSGENPDITSIENDNRKVEQGSLFICIKGYTVDGHDFAEAAVKSGAVAVIAEHDLPLNVPVIVVNDTNRAMAVLADAFYGQPSRKFKLVGITGTNGKTTVSHLIEKVLSDAGKKTGLIGTMYTKIGAQMIETKNTTPESLTLQKTFKSMADEGVEAAVMEVSSHALDEGRVRGTEFDVAVFTNLSQDHLDYHHTMEEYKHAKGLLFSQLGNTFETNKPKFAVLNVDDPASDSFMRGTSAHIITYGIDQKADISAKDITMTSKGTAFTLSAAGRELLVNMQLIGKFSVYNVLAGIGAGLALGMPLEHIIRSIEGVEGVAGRFELVNAGQDFTVIVDYAHTPDSLENVLSTISQFAQKKVFVVVGCGGDRDRTKRPLMAKIACNLATDPIFTSDNPRSEDPIEILKDMQAGAEGKSYQLIPDRKAAIEFAVKNASEGDVILIAGKGHETYQIIGSQVFDFDDRKMAKDAIEGR
ncbi:UDP-N-acetylmuramoyl-L-alanyl-D-glutamate--2,6-diaminopimelate ligase [Neobacillus sp. PS3-34]|uniref:UDP-N-acetylmuramoyl-L-alanyl-D-glutamate--2, 6-diaminopimelate ligase n=1 Tax=Neobacillus sp. PS3-34 TaxID=3070678 RepID=UPI0027E0C97B|nr:UDP-N-acetylmuramoyl-L-alanyl-D-glutamate--2,6-diaminopimelate ligase [Neobacillus sp. PS3-34]WML49345.1 UDP-N-acetylmuramoyl-L-alanyl-D-glutamate--2,6-diaminopimelate ligase [Neobacillus sp. PS3-34]